jgi:hypothetical protein
MGEKRTIEKAEATSAKNTGFD